MEVNPSLQIRDTPRRWLQVVLVAVAAAVAAPGMSAEDVPAAVAAAANEPDATPPTIVRVAEAQPPARREKKMVCRAEIPTGSHISTNRCRSRAQIEREEKESQDMIDEIRRREAHRN